MNREAAFLQMQLAVQSGRARSSLSVVRDFLHTYEGSRYADIVATTAFYNALQRGYLSQGLDFINEVQVQLHTEYYQAWAAYILGIYSDPEQLFRAMELRPGSYYSFRASHLLEKETEPVLNDALTGMYSLKSVEDSVLYELCSSGYVNEIEDMIQTALALADSETKPGYLFLLSRLYYMKGDPYRGITYSEKLLHSLGSPDLVSLPRPVLELLYPKVFGAEIAAVLKQRETDIEPCLILAIVREESRYNSSARSTKGAMGLMQLMPATASWIMRDDISPIDLRKPVVNISAGTAYLNYLFSRFDRTEHVVASYNGGPNIVAQWVRKNKGKPMEIFIEEIPYRETRNFVKRVYTSYQMYRLLYGDYEVLVD
jgi:hypothetical protein